MAKVKILIEGYSGGETKGHSCSTIVLIQDKGINIVVDPGTLPNQNLLKDKLKQENLTVKDITHVFITHSHMDHYRNIGMFPTAKTIDFWGLWEGDVWKKQDKKITKDISFVKTAGHSDDSVTLLVKTKKGVIAICGDVFWKKNMPEKDNFANDHLKLNQSRKKILELADYIIPGHGGMFKV
ncbi:MBL fold metallo-hydrolase [Candidatus Woesearchaeota archaeon]|mgnify:CR=1 FL=1|nr:MBL fold metallo-hydrolase [Candidatus Woesearchaeota archaeon]MBT5271772.1 MBL fold metallo-hydrolase [Candidatus Woesearchaeota archaeon]MBT6041187.1 MBL fold metallo-hydrolase [Candidatus Woesearchaeota archaeon]MBT6336308.1 MBL fold metallo-hydrolase [Candidatus Woesearchaeota archaeon]MBT7927306.1 MBL fold metallo-hydrolase [Candidatus Woesearchaeota archaeon]